MEIRILALLLAVAVACLGFGGARAEATGMVRSNLADHPVLHPVDGRKPAAWRHGLGAWGEDLVHQTLRLRGFNEIHEIKTPGNHGIDRIAIRRLPDGAIRDLKFVEVKTSLSSRPELSQTVHGRQMSRDWLERKLREIRATGVKADKRLALEIDRFMKASGRPIESFGEVNHINPKLNQVTRYSLDGKILSQQSAEGVLARIQKRGTRGASTWATRSLAGWDQIQSANLSSWVGESTVQKRRTALLRQTNGVAKALENEVAKQSGKRLGRMIARTAGPIGALISLAIDAKELANTEIAYQRGYISVRERNIRHASSVGGIAGAFAGASGGAAIGTWAGAFGGPFAWITVPAGGVLGGAIGGVAGYFGGSTAGGYAALAWYRSIDTSVRERFEQEWVARN